MSTPEITRPGQEGQDVWQRQSSPLSASVPPGWIRKDSLELFHPTGIANIIASTEPVPDEIDVKGWFEAQGEALRSAIGTYREIQTEEIRAFNGLDGYMRIFEHTPENGIPFTQIQLYAVSRGRGITATATSTTSEFREIELTLVQILKGLEFDDRPTSNGQERTVAKQELDENSPQEGPAGQA
jgi:hypothetical protein